MTRTRAEIAVTGLGMITAAGIGADATWNGVLAAKSTASVDPDLAGLDVAISCHLADFPTPALLAGPWGRRADRHSQLALAAAEEALASARLGGADWEPDRIAVVMGSAFGGVRTLEEEALKLGSGARVSALTVPMVTPNMVAGQLSLQFGAHGPSFSACTACASGATAIGLGMQLLRNGDCDIAIVGGTEAPTARVITAAFARMGSMSRHDDPRLASRPFDTARDGFVLGEGAAVLVLERLSYARGRNAPVLARLLGYGASADAHHITEPHPEGSGLARAAQEALAQAGADGRDVDHVSAHATSTPKGDLAEATLISHLYRNNPAVTATKGVLGHTMGAAGAVSAALTVMSLRKQLIPPTANLDHLDARIEADVVADAPRNRSIHLAVSHASGFGGQNAALVFAPV